MQPLMCADATVYNPIRSIEQFTRCHVPQRAAALQRRAMPVRAAVRVRSCHWSTETSAGQQQGCASRAQASGPHLDVVRRFKRSILLAENQHRLHSRTLDTKAETPMQHRVMNCGRAEHCSGSPARATPKHTRATVPQRSAVAPTTYGTQAVTQTESGWSQVLYVAVHGAYCTACCAVLHGGCGGDGGDCTAFGWPQ